LPAPPAGFGRAFTVRVAFAGFAAFAGLAGLDGLDAAFRLPPLARLAFLRRGS
jgi:hypothetical protein